jgi:hypothetical protein
MHKLLPSVAGCLFGTAINLAVQCVSLAALALDVHPRTTETTPVQIVRFWVAQLSKLTPVFPAAAAQNWPGIATLAGIMLEHRYA